MAEISSTLRERLAATVDSIADQVFVEGGGLQPGHPASMGDYRSVAAKMISTALLARLSETSPQSVSPMIMRGAAAHFARLGIPLQLLLDRIDLTQTIALRTWWPLVDEDEVFDMLSFSSLLADTIGAIKRDMTRGYHAVNIDSGATALARIEIADRLLAGEPPAAEDVARTGVWISETYTVFCTPWPIKEADSAGHDTLSAVCADHDFLWARRLDTLLILVPGSRRRPVDRLLVDLVEDLAGEPRTFGCSRVHETSSIPVAVNESADALRLATLCGGKGAVSYESLALERALWHDPSARNDLLAMVDELGRHPHLIDTLDVFYRSGMDRKATAAELGVTPGTLTSRLRRIGDLTGHAPATGRGAAILSAAMTARRMDQIQDWPT